MRTLPLNVDQSLGDFVESLRSPTRYTLPDLVQNDTLQLAVTKLTRNDPDAADYYVSEPWSFSEIRASIGLVDNAPNKGEFKIRISGTGATGDTAAITWPTDLTPAGITTWKGTVIAAINAVAGANAARLDDPDATPVNFLYVTWTNAADDRAFELVSVALVPPIDTSESIRVLQTAPKQTLIKIVQLPIVEQNVFVFPAAPLPTIEPDTTGAPGINEVQILNIPTLALGAFDLTWSGAHTAPLAVAGLTAAQLADALNAIVPAGTTNPSFSVVARSLRRFAITFTGPLAGSDQPLLVLTPRDQRPLTTAYGTLPLTAGRFERALNGAASVKLSLELVITDAGGESTILRTFNLINDMTGPGTAGSAEEQGAVLTVTETVYVPVDTLDPYVSVAAGSVFTPPAPLAAGAAMVVNHALGTRNPDVWIDYECTLDPEEWTALPLDGLWSWKSTDADHIELTFAVDLTDTPADTYYRGRLRIYLRSPDAQLTLLGGLSPLWSQVRETNPDGKTAAEKFAEIDALFAVVDGKLKMPAANVDGKLSPDQIDLLALIKAILALIRDDANAMQQFLDLIDSSTVISSILNAFTSSTNIQKFIDALTKVFQSSTLISTLIDAITNALFSNPTFLSLFRINVIAAFQAGGTLPPGFIPIAFEDWEMIVPPIHQADGPSAPVLVDTLEVTTVAGGETTKETVPKIKNVPTTQIPEYELLPVEIVGATADATIAGTVKLSDLTDGHTRAASADVNVRTIGARRGRTHATGTILGRRNGIVFPVRMDGGNAWPCEMERRFFATHLDDGTLYLDSRFALNFTLQTQLAGNALGRLDFVIETGTFSHEGAETRDINAITWAAQLTRPVPLGADLRMMSVAIAITRQTSVTIGDFLPAAVDPVGDTITFNGHNLANTAKVRLASTATLPAPFLADTDYFVREATTNAFKLETAIGAGAINITTAGTGTLTLFARDVRTGTISINGQAATSLPVPALPFAVRCGIINFDAENVTDGAKGALIARVKSPACSVAKYTAV